MSQLLTLLKKLFPIRNIYMVKNYTKQLVNFISHAFALFCWHKQDIWIKRKINPPTKYLKVPFFLPTVKLKGPQAPNVSATPIGQMELEMG